MPVQGADAFDDKVLGREKPLEREDLIRKKTML